MLYFNGNNNTLFAPLRPFKHSVSSEGESDRKQTKMTRSATRRASSRVGAAAAAAAAVADVSKLLQRKYRTHTTVCITFPWADFSMLDRYLHSRYSVGAEQRSTLESSPGEVSDDVSFGVGTLVVVDSIELGKTVPRVCV